MEERIEAMMAIHKLKSLLEVAEARRTDNVPNSDEWVARKLREDKVERVDLLSKIQGDPLVADQALELEAEIASIEHALTAYPSLDAA